MWATWNPSTIIALVLVVPVALGILGIGVGFADASCSAATAELPESGHWRSCPLIFFLGFLGLVAFVIVRAIGSFGKRWELWVRMYALRAPERDDVLAQRRQPQLSGGDLPDRRLAPVRRPPGQHGRSLLRLRQLPLHDRLRQEPHHPHLGIPGVQPRSQAAAHGARLEGQQRLLRHQPARELRQGSDPVARGRLRQVLHALLPEGVRARRALRVHAGSDGASDRRGRPVRRRDRRRLDVRLLERRVPHR